MSAWDDIDRKAAQFKRELAGTSNAVEGWGGVKDSTKLDETGMWSCRYIPRGERQHVTLTSRSADELVGRLKAIREAERKKSR